MTPPVFFNAHHSPIGAFASLTLGQPGAKGGLGLELGGPADRAVYVGVEERDEPGRFRALPFYGEAQTQDAEDYDVEGLGDFHRAAALQPFTESSISRTLGASVDEWRAGDLTFRIVSPVRSVPDPETGSGADLKKALAPAVSVELTVDNRQGKNPRKAFFGYAGGDASHAMRVMDEPGLTGVAQGLTTAIATADEGVYAGLAWQPEAILMPRHQSNLGFMLGSIGLLVGEVPAGEIKTFRFAVGFFREGTATTGIETRYLYRRWFDRVEEVVRFALESAKQDAEEAAAFDRALAERLSPERAFQLAHAIRSYYGSTQLLERRDGRPLWVVNEGEYRMMNTFDLTIDQAFFELALNPWTLRNELDLFIERYSYEDRVRLPGGGETYEGGIAFTHDMGVANCFSAPGTSCYEQAGLTGCFSYMSGEELLNWAICASLYVDHTNDEAWLQENANVFEAAVKSLLNRDHPNPDERNGVQGLDGDRCDGGWEITTYDSLDASLGQARNNLYLAVKSWSAYVLLEPIFKRLGREDLAKTVRDQAARCATTVVHSADEEGLLPAVIGEGVEARIIPAIEALVYPWITGQADALSIDGPFGDLRRALEWHFDLVLDKGHCRFADGGWRLSSTSRNSWLSKIYLCQAVAEQILGKDPDNKADGAHVNWLLQKDNAYFAWSDQMLEGKAVGSRYYPRGVTAILWLTGGERPLQHLTEILNGSKLEVA
ncbi:beta-xylosidase [bacterium]|nr:MAG: beta-xylosidase [bacterium]